MAVPLTVQLFDAFLGQQEGIHSVILPDIYSSGGSKNLYIDKYGRAKKILGYAKQNATAVTTDTGASATMVREIVPYRAPGTYSRVLLACFDDQTDEFEIWKSTDSGATWTFVQDLGAGSINSIPDFAQLGSTLVFTNGVVAPRKFDGTTWSTATESQLAAPTLSGSTSGNLTGTYKWKILPITSAGARKFASASSAATVLQALQQTVTWVADPDGTVVGYEIYRTSGTGATYYFVSFSNGRTTVTFVDNTDDLTILENRVLEEHGDNPPTSYHCEAHKQRMWYFRTAADPQAGYYSDPGFPDSVPVTNKLNFIDAETIGDTIVGATGDFEGQMVVWQERSIWTVTGTGEIIGNITDWSALRTNAVIGTVHKRSVVRVPAGSKYTDQNGKTQVTPTVTLGYFTPLGDIRLFDSDNDIIISNPIKTTLSTFNYSQRSKIFALQDISRDEITWIYPDGTSGEPNKAVTWNYHWGVWYPRDWAFSCGTSLDTTTTAQLLLAGSNSTATGGRLYQLWSGGSFDGSNINSVWMTKTLYGVTPQAQPALAQTKRWRWGDFLFQTDATVTLTIEWVQGNSTDDAAGINSTTITPTTDAILSANGDQILSTNGDVLMVSQASAQKRALFLDSGGDYLHHEGLRLRVSDNATLGSWSLEALALAYQILPGLDRRMQG